MTKDDVVNAARAQIGTPFRHQGRLPGVALDCAGLVVTVAQDLGVEHVDVIGYGRRPTGELRAVMAAQQSIEQVPIADRQAGDILVMRFAKEPQHLAICAGTTIIHSYETVKKCCEHDMTHEWAKRITEVWRFVGIES